MIIFVINFLEKNVLTSKKLTISNLRILIKKKFEGIFKGKF